MILNVVQWTFIVCLWVVIAWHHKEMRKQRRIFKEFNNIIADIKHEVQWTLSQRGVLSKVLWGTGFRGVKQIEDTSRSDSPVRIVTVSVTSNAVVVSSPGEEEFVLRVKE